MEAEGRPTDHPVVRRLREHPREFGFFQAIRLIELAHPGAVPLGRGGPASREAARLQPSSSLAFQAAEVTRYAPGEGEGAQDRLATTVMGLYGVGSPIPAFYSTDILEWEMQNPGETDPVRSFLDIFNHRLLSLLYRAWSKYRWAFTFRLDAVDDVSRAVLSLAGIGDESLREALGLPAQRLLRFAGFITQIPRSAGGLAGVLSDYFDDVPADVTQCVQRWVPVAPQDQSRLGAANSRLGDDLVLGESILDRTGKFRVELGPLDDLSAFERFLPTGRHFGPLGALIQFLVTDPLEYDLRLGLRGEAVPMLRLTVEPAAPRLGWTTWLRSDPESPDKWEIFAPPLPAAA